MVVLFLFSLWSAAQASGAPPAPLHGTVRDQTGAVLQGARVELVDESAAVVRSGLTDARGDYSLDGVPAGTYHLDVHFEGFRPATVRIRVAAGRPPAPQRIVLDLAS